MTAPGQARLRAFAPALLVVSAALAAHAADLTNGFVWDDETIVVENPDTRDVSTLPRVLLSPDETRPYYRPLNRGSYLLDFQLFGMEPRGFHLVNVLLHAAGALLLYAVTSRGRLVHGSLVPARRAAPRPRAEH